MKRNQGSTNVLLVEDNDIDAAMVLRAATTGGSENAIHRVADGSQALDFLRRQGDFEDSPSTDLVLLDLNLPGIDGHDVLATMKADPDLNDIPVVILTSSNLDQDVKQAYKKCAAAFVKKPFGRDGYAKLVSAMESFWLEAVVYPSK